MWFHGSSGVQEPSQQGGEGPTCSWGTKGLRPAPALLMSWPRVMRMAALTWLGNLWGGGKGWAGAIKSEEGGNGALAHHGRRSPPHPKHTASTAQPQHAT